MIFAKAYTTQNSTSSQRHKRTQQCIWTKILPFLTFRVAVEVVDKVRDGVVKSCSGDAVVVLAVVHKLQTLSLVDSYEDVIVEELPLVVEKLSCLIKL